jgi:hypothetical protein
MQISDAKEFLWIYKNSLNDMNIWWGVLPRGSLLVSVTLFCVNSQTERNAVDSLVLLNSRNARALIICQTACGFVNEMSALAFFRSVINSAGTGSDCLTRSETKLNAKKRVSFTVKCRTRKLIQCLFIYVQNLTAQMTFTELEIIIIVTIITIQINSFI